jgi:uncharacterized protein (TIGR00369 family)
MNTQTIRSGEITWDDPLLSAAQIAAVPGIEFLHAIGRGDLPDAPMGRTLGIEPVRVEAGRAVFAVVPDEYHYNPLGLVHGGLAATLCDTALGCAVHSMLPAGTGYTTLELKVNFVRPITARTGRLESEGTVVHLGSRTATAEARVVDAQGKLYAHASATCLLLDLAGSAKPTPHGAHENGTEG